ncbi:hypothetical protein CAMRE0001_2541 [Campylobacter rectus RM3267]|uniref:Uncharacterized protein n=1 Tax=Campylobacter rectus RM3267 TaxID=553218 RepID=B9D3S7_CAMRE|nr:hypothetical protein CAMRE0001_2541 [Campylobacter rectus RM3267]
MPNENKLANLRINAAQTTALIPRAKGRRKRCSKNHGKQTEILRNFSN